MRARDFITEIDRRGFLKGFGAAAASAAIPGIAKAQTGKDVFRIDTKSKEFLDAAKMLKDYFKKNLKVSPNVSQYTHGMFKIRFNGQGKILSVDFESPLGNPALEKAVKDSIIDIPNNIITSFQLEPADTSFIKFSTKNYLPEPTTSGTTDKEPSAGDNEVTKVQKAVNIILKERPNSKIKFITYYQTKDNREMISAEGTFGNNEIFCLITPTGWNLGILGRMAHGDNLEKPYVPLFGDKSKKDNWIFALEKYGESKSNRYYLDNSNQVTTTNNQIAQSGKGIERFGDSVMFTGYTVDEIKDRIIDKVLLKDKDTQVEDNGRMLILKIHDPQSKNFGMAIYKGLFGPKYSNMDVTLKFIFTTKGNQIRVIPQAAISITNAFGRTETTPMNSGEALDGLENLF